MTNKWVKFKNIDKQTKTMYLPTKMFPKTNKDISLCHGLKKIKVRIISIDTMNNGAEFDDPFIIRCSKDVIDELMIFNSLTYQLLINEDSIHIGPVIGFLMGEQHYYYHDRLLQDMKDAMRIYHEAGGLYIVFKLTGINWAKEHLYGLYYEFQEKKWKYAKLPLPTVIFRRSFQRQGEEVQRLQQLTEGKIFNTFKLDKYEVYQKLKNHKSFTKYLPHTEVLKSIYIFYDFIKKYKKIILKPKGLSRGRGICIIEEIDQDLYIIDDYRDSTQKKQFILPKKEILKFIISNRFLNKNYLIQPYLMLAHIDGNVFDIRIVMQKNSEFQWQCSGIECRIAGKGNKLTNISIGGKALNIEDTINIAYRGKLNAEQVKEDIIDISKKFCHIMDENDGIFAEYGLDLAMDIHGQYWFIEGNFRPAFKGFQLIDYEIYYEICYTTVRYATALAGFKKGGKKDEHKV